MRKESANCRSPAERNLLIKLLTDQSTSIDQAEHDSYFPLLHDLLGEENARAFAAYRERLPREQKADAGLAHVAATQPNLAEVSRAALRNALAEVPVNNPTYRSIMAQPRITEADMNRAAAQFLADFDARIATLPPADVDPAALAACALGMKPKVSR